MGNVRDLFISSKKFKAEALNVQGYSIVQVTKSKAKKQSFRDKLDVVCDMDEVVKALENKGYVYAYTRSSRVKALFISRKDGHTFSCNEAFIAEEIKDEPVVNLMEAQVAFLLAQRASGYSDGKAIFMDTEMPKLVVKSGKFNWPIALTFSITMSLIYSTCFQKPQFIPLGVALGMSIGLCFQEHWYEYEGVSEDTSKDTSSAE